MSLGLLVAASPGFAQTSGRRSVWTVAEMRDLRSRDGKYGREATSALAESLTAAGATVVASPQTGETPTRATSMENLRAVALDGGASVGTIMSGEFVDWRIVRLKGARRAVVALRLVMVDAASGLVVGGDWEKGESENAGRGTTDAALIAEATRQAASLAARSLSATCPPTATVLTMCFDNPPLANRGSDQGFGSARRVVVIRGGRVVGQGSIGASEKDQSEIVPDNDSGRIAPGDLVRLVVAPPAAAPVGKSVFDLGCSGLAGPRRRGR